MSLEDNKMVGFDVVGIHPVAYRFDKEGCVLRVEDVRDAVKEIYNRLEKHTDNITRLQIEFDEVFGFDQTLPKRGESL